MSNEIEFSEDHSPESIEAEVEKILMDRVGIQYHIDNRFRPEDKKRFGVEVPKGKYLNLTYRQFITAVDSLDNERISKYVIDKLKKQEETIGPLDIIK